MRQDRREDNHHHHQRQQIGPLNTRIGHSSHTKDDQFNRQETKTKTETKRGVPNIFGSEVVVIVVVVAAALVNGGRVPKGKGTQNDG